MSESIRSRGYNPNKFKAYLIEHGFDPPNTFASVLGLSSLSFGKKLRGDSVWKHHELLRIKVYFKMTNDKFCGLFYDTSDEMFQSIQSRINLHDTQMFTE